MMIDSPSCKATSCYSYVGQTETHALFCRPPVLLQFQPQPEAIKPARTKTLTNLSNHNKLNQIFGKFSELALFGRFLAVPIRAQFYPSVSSRAAKILAEPVWGRRPRLQRVSRPAPLALS